MVLIFRNNFIEAKQKFLAAIFTNNKPASYFDNNARMNVFCCNHKDIEWLFFKNRKNSFELWWSQL